MSGQRSANDIQVTVGKDLSTAMRQGTKIEVSPDSNVIVYTNEGVQTKPAASVASPKGTHISEDFNTVVLNRATIEWAADGRLVISTPGTVITKPAPANDTGAKAKAALRIGDPHEGGVYVGKSATTGKDLHAALADEGEYLTFEEALAAAETMKKQPGRENAHVPTPEELNVNLYQNKGEGALKGTFNTSGSFPAGCYRSSAPYGLSYARVQYFDNGNQSDSYRSNRLPVRLVW